MAMISLDIKDDTGCCPTEYDPCPKVYLSAAQAKALGITTPPRAGTMLAMRAVVEVDSVTESESKDEGHTITLALCIEYAELGPAPSGSNAKLYADAD